MLTTGSAADVWTLSGWQEYVPLIYILYTHIAGELMKRVPGVQY